MSVNATGEPPKMTQFDWFAISGYLAISYANETFEWREAERQGEGQPEHWDALRAKFYTHPCVIKIEGIWGRKGERGRPLPSSGARHRLFISRWNQGATAGQHS